MTADIPFAAVRSLEAIAMGGSLTEAARELGMSSAGLGQRIAALEALIGVDVLDHSRKPLKLSSAGALFLASMRRAMDQFDSGFAQLRGDGRTVEVTVAYTLTTEGQIVEELARRAEESLPRHRLLMRRLWTSEISEAVAAGSADVGIARHPPWWADLRIELLWETPLVLRVPRAHRLADSGSVSLAELAGEPLRVVPRELSPGSYDIVESTFLAAGVLPQLVNSPVIYTRIADQDMDSVGASVGPQLTTAELAPEFVQVPLEGVPGGAKIGLHAVSRHSDRENYAIAAVLDLLRRIAVQRRADIGTRGELS